MTGATVVRGGRSRARTVAWGTFAVGAVLTSATVALIVLNWSTPGAVGLPTSSHGAVDVAYALALLVTPSVGALVVAHRPENPIGWILAGSGLAAVVTSFAQEFGFYGLLTEPSLRTAGYWSAWVSTATYNLSDPLLTMLLVLFPSGRPIRGQRLWAVPLAVASLVALTFVHAVGIPMLNTPFEFESNSLGPSAGSGLETAFAIAGGLGFLAFVIAILAGLVSQVLRMRRARGVERAQLKWMLLAAAVVAASWLGWATAPAGTAAAGVMDVYVSFTQLVIPVAAGAAILRYRLYDIDVVINRALVYGSLTAATVASYVALVVGLGWAARGITGQEGNEVVVAATTLIVAGLFQPARRRIQGVVDRRFYRAKYDAGRTIEAFQARLRDELELDTLRGELAAAVHSALQPAVVAVWLRPAGAR